MTTFLIESIAAVSEQEPGQRYSSNQSHWFNHRTNMLHIGGHSDENMAGHLADHEFSHFGLHCSTPYGLVLDDLCHMQTQLVFGFCHRFGVDLAGQKIPRPVYRFAQKYGSNLELLEAHYPELGALTSLSLWFLEPWSLSLFLENALEGEGPASQLRSSDAKACAAVAAFEAYFVQEDTPWPIKAKPLTPERLFGDRAFGTAFRPLQSLESLGLERLTTCHRMTFPRSSPIPLGGFDVFEGVAILLEGLQGRGQEIARLVADLNGQRYMSMWTLFMTTYPGLKHLSSENDYYALVRTFLTLCELALYIPIGPVYGRLRHSTTTWLDVQPAYRFLRAVDMLQPNEWLCGEEGLGHLQETVCGRLYWPEPRRFLELGASLQPVNSHYARHRDACAARLRHPWIFIRDLANEDDFEPFFKAHCPIFAYKASIMEGAETRATATIRHFMSKLSWRIMFQGSYIWTEDLIPQFTLNGGNNRKQDLATTLDALPFLKPDNFELVNSI